MPKTVKVQEYEKLFKKFNRLLDKKIKGLKDGAESLKVSSRVEDGNNSKFV